MQIREGVPLREVERKGWSDLCTNVLNFFRRRPEAWLARLLL
jgi:hypothetical protein